MRLCLRLLLLGAMCSVLVAAVLAGDDMAHPHGSSATTNYASSYLGAKIVDHHPKAKGTHNLLNDDRDKYMIVPCREGRKQFTVQLSREIELSIVAISNHEYFSSGTRNFTLLGTNRYPCVSPSCMWRVLGSFTADFTRTTQRFVVAKQQPVKFLRFQWVTHHGQEKSCTMTSLHAYGTDMLETLAAELNSPDSPDEDDVEEEAVTGRTETQYVQQEEVVAPDAPNATTAPNISTIFPSAIVTPAKAEQPTVKKWKSVPVVFPPRNSSTSVLRQCAPLDRATEIFYELGPGARCYKKKEQRPKDKVNTANILALPHMQRQMRALQQDVQRLAKQLAATELNNAHLSQRLASLSDKMSREDRAQLATLESLQKRQSSLAYTMRVHSTQWELYFSDASTGAASTATEIVVWWLVGSNALVLMILVATCYGRTMSAAMHTGPRPSDDVSPTEQKARMFPLSSSSTNLSTFTELEETNNSDAEADDVEAKE